MTPTKTAPAATARSAAKAGSPTPGTRVQLIDGAKHKGTVMPYTASCSPCLLGLFPVRLDNAIWQICGTSDVIILTPPSTQIDSEAGAVTGT
jgi:hypothetical protein